MGLAAFNQMRLRQYEEMKPENIVKTKVEDEKAKVELAKAQAEKEAEAKKNADVKKLKRK